MICDFQMHLIGSFIISIIYYSKLLQLEIASELLNQSVSIYLLSNLDIQNGGQLSRTWVDIILQFINKVIVSQTGLYKCNYAQF